VKVPFLDLSRGVEAQRRELEQAVAGVLSSARFVLGERVAEFEHAFAAYCGAREAVGVASGTEAIAIALRAVGVEPGDEVIVPANTCVPTVAGVEMAGAVAVLADVDPVTWTLDPASAAAAVTERTRAVLPVHLYGLCADVDALRGLGLKIVEDAAQAHGAELRGRRAGTLGDAAAFSFYPTKNLGALGDGGAVVTDDPELAAAVRHRRAHGLAAGYEHTVIAGNSRLSEVEAAALRVGLGRLAGGNARRRAVAVAYRAAAPTLQWQAAHDRHVYHLCVARVPDRDAFRVRVPFDTAVHYPRALTQQPAYSPFTRDPCPEAEHWAAECISLPCFPELTDDEIGAVCRAIG
jgi:dTDP-3-amino-3,4,6-trideoxy-alpha-D-glucose transaminase